MNRQIPPVAPLRIRRALISVSDKSGIADFAASLQSFGVEIISTGGTYAVLKNAGVRVKSVSEVTGFPEILDGRVKTLHPSIHAGLLAIRDNPEHVRQLKEHHIEPIDLLVSNLYPFEATIARPQTSLAEAVEQIDIGGPAMVRASAKNYRHTAVIVNPNRYQAVLDELRALDGAIGEETRYRLACEAFEHTAHYDSAISMYLTSQSEEDGLPAVLSVSEQKSMPLRYGENPHQAAAFYGSLEGFEKLHGKELSYNNLLDVHAAIGLCAEFEEPAVIIVKHNNPCGAATGHTLVEAYEKALATDPKSAFGGIVAVNKPVDRACAEAMNPLFLEVIVAPDFAADALPLLTKKKDRRLLRIRPELIRPRSFEIRPVLNGYLVEEPDLHHLNPEAVKTVTRRKPTETELQGLFFAWRIAKHVKSNAVIYARGDRTLGIGAGQMSRVDSSRIAAMKAADAGLDLKGCSVASDAFFPFPDGLLETVKAGGTAVIQPGGSVRDEEVIRAADDNNIAMVFTGIRHFRH